MRVRALLALGAAALVGLAAPAPAQQQQQPTDPAGRRATAEQQLRQRIGQVVQKRLGLTDDQLRRLARVNQSYEPQMTALFRQERQVRLRLQPELRGPDSTANQQLVDTLMNQFFAIQRQRLELVERENRELAAFLTPVQRVKLFEMREQIRRRLEEQRRNNARARRQGDGQAPVTPF